MILDSSMVEHTAVNRGVVGSSPTRGARPPCEKRRVKNIRLRGQAVKTSPFHGGNTGSIPVGVISFNKFDEVKKLTFFIPFGIIT